jgi:hypothetical protein
MKFLGKHKIRSPEMVRKKQIKQNKMEQYLYRESGRQNG